MTVTTAEKTAFPVYRNGLGTVQAFNTVFVRTRVDGQIEKVAFKEGQTIKAGDLLVQIDARPYQAALDQANAKKAQDQAALVNTKADLQRLISLGKYATRQQTDTQQTTVNQTTAQLALDQATIDNAATQLSYTTIRAPIGGMTGFRQVDVGNIVNAAAQTGIVTIAQIEPISVMFTLPEEQLQDINGALAAGPVPVIAYSTDGQKKLSEGTLSVINNQVDAASGTVRLKATVRQPGPCAVAGSVGGDPDAGAHTCRRRRHSRRGRPARSERPLCLCGRRRRQSDAAGHCREPVRRWPLGRLEGPCGRPEGHHGGAIPGPAGSPGGGSGPDRQTGGAEGRLT